MEYSLGNKRLPFCFPSIALLEEQVAIYRHFLCPWVIPGQYQEDLLHYTPGIPNTSNELPEGPEQSFSQKNPQMKSIKLHPSGKEVQPQEPDALQCKLCLGDTHSKCPQGNKAAGEGETHRDPR